MAEEQVKKTGFEIAQKLDAEKTMWERMAPDKGQIMAALYGCGALFIVFLIGCWLAGNPFQATQRIASTYVKEMGWMGTNEWAIIWSVVWVAMAFEFMDATAGMGFGTAITPLLMLMGFDPKQIVPVVMIQQGVAGLVGTFLHAEYENVEWKFKPMSETIKLWLYIASPRNPGRHDLGDLGLRHLQGGQGVDQPLRLRAAARHGRDFPLSGNVRQGQS